MSSLFNRRKAHQNELLKTGDKLSLARYILLFPNFHLLGRVVLSALAIIKWLLLKKNIALRWDVRLDELFGALDLDIVL